MHSTSTDRRVQFEDHMAVIEIPAMLSDVDTLSSYAGSVVAS
jgi:hypothetical protein